MRDLTEFVKVPGGKQTSLVLDSHAQIPLGGEGAKYHATLVGEEGGTPVGEFVMKEYDSKTEAMAAANKCGQLRKDGIPTHATSRYFERDGTYFVLYTDETHGGSRRVWSVNNPPSELRSLGISRENVEARLRPVLEAFAEQLTKKGWGVVGDDAYWLIEDGGNLSVMIGDISFRVRKENNKFLETANLDTVERLIAHIQDYS